MIIDIETVLLILPFSKVDLTPVYASPQRKVTLDYDLLKLSITNYQQEIRQRTSNYFSKVNV